MTEKRTESTHPLYEDSNSDSDSVVRPSIYPQGKHLPTERRTVLEEYYGGKVAELEILTELKSHRLEGFYNLSFLILVFALAYLIVRNVREYGWRPSLIISCPYHLWRDLKFFFKFWMCLLVASLSSLGLIKLRVRKGWSFSTSGVLATHYIFICVIYMYSATTLMNDPINVFFGSMLGCFVVIVTMKMHSYVSTNLLLVDEVKRKKQARARDAGSNIKGKMNKSSSTVSLSESETIRTADIPKGKAKAICAFPHNVTLGNYVYYIILVPQLVYETTYPRSKVMRKSAFLGHCTTFCLCLIVQYIIVMQFMVPVFRNLRDDAPYWFLVAKLAIPSFSVWLLFFFSFFHSFLNALAEVAYFADRNFYLDWWNATTLDSFWRKWNIPVHEWCLRHIVVESVSKLHVKPRAAAFTTFLLSALLHEYVFVVGFKMVRPYMFIGILIQLPLIRLTHFDRYKGKRRGNVLIWILLFLGHPLMELLYFREYFRRHSSFFCN